MERKKEEPKQLFANNQGDFGNHLSNQFNREVLERNQILQNGEQRAFERLGVHPNANMAVQRGQVFEEITFALIEAQIHDHQLPIRVYQGDGQGMIEFNGQLIRTPDGTDMIIENQLFRDLIEILQLKVSNTPEGLRHLVRESFDIHPDGTARPNTANAKLDPDFYEKFHPRKAKFVTTRGNGQTIEVTNGDRIEQVEVSDKVIVGDKEIQVPSSQECEDWISKLQALIPKQAQIHANKQKIQWLKGVVKRLQSQHDKIPDSKIESRNRFQEQISKAYQELEKLANDTKQLEVEIEQDFVEFFPKIKSRDFIFSRMKEAAIIGGLVSGVQALIISFIDNLQKYQKGEIGILQLFESVSYETTKGAVKGGVLSALIVGFEAYGISLLAENSADLLGHVFKKAGVLCLNGQLSKEESQIKIARISVVGILNTSISVIAASCWGGPVGMLIGISGSLIVGTIDYFFGQSICDKIFPQIQRIEGIPPLGCEPMQKPQFGLQFQKKPDFHLELQQKPQFGLNRQQAPRFF
eukprot:403352027